MYIHIESFIFTKDKIEKTFHSLHVVVAQDIQKDTEREHAMKSLGNSSHGQSLGEDCLVDCVVCAELKQS